MPDYRQIHTEFWSDPWTENLPPMDKYLFIYLFSNKRTTLLGLYEISTRLMAYETGLDEDAIRQALARFAQAGKAFYVDGIIWVPKMPERNALNLRSPKVQANIKATFLSARDCALTRRCLAYWNGIIVPRYGIDTVSIPYLQNKTKQNTTEQNIVPPLCGGAEAPEGEGSESMIPEPEPETPEPGEEEPGIPQNFEDWLALVEKPPKNSNRHAVLARMYVSLFPTKDPPDFGYIGKTAKNVGGAGRLAALLWQANAARPTGDVLAYCVGIAKGGKSNGSNSGDDTVSIQGHIPRGATPEEFNSGTG